MFFFLLSENITSILLQLYYQQTIFAQILLKKIKFLLNGKNLYPLPDYQLIAALED